MTALLAELVGCRAHIDRPKESLLQVFSFGGAGVDICVECGAWRVIPPGKAPPKAWRQPQIVVRAANRLLAEEALKRVAEKKGGGE